MREHVKFALVCLIGLLIGYCAGDCTQHAPAQGPPFLRDTRKKVRSQALSVEEAIEQIADARRYWGSRKNPDSDYRVGVRYGLGQALGIVMMIDEEKVERERKEGLRK